MIYTFADGTTKEVEVGQVTNRVKKQFERPVTVTLTYSELVAIRKLPDYIHEVYQCMDVRKAGGGV